MSAQLRLRCGCVVPFDDGGQTICPRHGLQSVSRTIGMRKPTVRGVASGPLVQTMDLPAWTGRIAGSETTDA
jgi:hypothetical protein